MNRYCLLLIILLYVSRLDAQSLEQSMFDHYTKADGMSDNAVKGIAEDSAGFLWISTVWGLNRFNGEKFIQYHSSNDSSSLPADDIYGMNWLDDHRLAVYGTGVHIIDTRSSERHNLFIPYHNKKYQFKYNMVLKVLGDKDGNTFVLGRSGFYHFDKGYRLVSRFDYYSDSETPLHHFYFGATILEVDENKLLVISINGLYTYDKKIKRLQKTTAAEFPLLSEAMSYPNPPLEFFQVTPGEFFIFKTSADSILYVDLNRNIKKISRIPIKIIWEIGWRSKMLPVNDTLFYITGQMSGIYILRLDKKNGNVQFFPQKKLGEYACYAIEKDRENRLLIGTSKGLLRQRLQRHAVEAIHLPATLQQQFPNVRLDDIYVTEDNVYAATREAGLAIFDRHTLAFKKNTLLTKYGEEANYLRAITKVNDHLILLGGHGVPILFNTRLRTTTNLVPPDWKTHFDWASDQLNDGQGNIWINSTNIYRWNIQRQKFSIIPPLPQLLTVPTATAADKSGNIWFGSHGIARYNISTGSYDRYLDSFPYIKIPDMQVRAIAVDEENHVWFGSNNNGLIVYYPEDKIFRHFTKKDGLPDNAVYGIVAVGRKVWVACYSGIACIDINQLKVTGFGNEDGFPSSTIGEGSRFFYDSIRQQLYIGFKDVLVRFKPDQVLQNKLPPKIFIESAKFNGTDFHYLPGQTLTTSWKQTELTVTIGSINFFDASTQLYAYRVVSKDSVPWMELGKQPSFSIAQLPPGHHLLQVKIYSASNHWPEQRQQIEITVTPPFWLQPWFVVLASLLVLGLIYYFVRWRAFSARKKEMVNTQMEKLRAEDYKSQFELEQISNYFSSSLADKKTADDVLWDVAGNLIGRLEYEDCVIYLWNKDKTKMIQKSAFGPKGQPGVILNDAFEVEPGQGIVGHVIEGRKPLLVNDTRKDARYRQDDKYRLSELAVPIIHDDELLGVIDSEHSRAGYFSDRDVKILTTIATLIGNKIKQIESEQSLEAKKLELASINEQLAEARLSALQAQMNPHFVFNALNSIKRMILDADNEKASRYLSKFALMIRMTLEHSKETFVTLQDNIQYLKAYLEMERLRFDGGFGYTIITDESVDITDTMLPSMVIQPLVENAIWHGLMHSDNDKKLYVHFEQEQEKIICTIEDNGIGIRHSEQLRQEHRPMHRSMGLSNLQNRIKIMNEKYHTECSLEITDLKETGLKPCGTKAVLTVNIIKT